MTKSNRLVGPEKGVQVLSIPAIITDKGKVVSLSVLEKYESDATTKQLETTEKWNSENIIEPPYNLASLMSWIDQNVIHGSCVRTKVQDTVGLGVYFEPEDESKREDVESDATYKLLEEFFNNVNQKEGIVTVLKKVMMDYEGCANAYIEVSRGQDGKVNGLYHVNATTVRWAKTKDMLIQKVQEKTIYFKLFGDERILDRFTGVFVKEQSNLDRIANELIPLAQYSYKSSVYGVPEWLPALFSMYGDAMEREYNLEFFVNYGVPAYALIIEGASITKDVQEEITKYFETQLKGKGSNHKTLTLSTPKGVTVKFERLSVDTKEASFRFYKEDNRSDILTAHHVPPYRVGVATQGSLGGDVATEMDSIYLDSVINPRQSQIAWLLNEMIIKKGLEIKGWLLQLNDINVKNKLQEAQVYTQLFQMGVMSPNEIRKELGYEGYEGGDVFYINGGMVAVGGKDNVEAPVETPVPQIPEETEEEPEKKPEEKTKKKQLRKRGIDPSEGLTAEQLSGKLPVDAPNA